MTETTLTKKSNGKPPGSGIHADPERGTPYLIFFVG
jgi:hypothetical protein